MEYQERGDEQDLAGIAVRCDGGVDVGSVNIANDRRRHIRAIRARLFGRKYRRQPGHPPKCAMMPIRGNLRRQLSSQQFGTQ